MTTTAPHQSDTLDGRLVKDARNGDRTAFDQLVELHAFPAWRLALALGSSASIAEEAVPTGFVTAFRGLSRGTLAPTTPFRLHVVRASGEAAALAARDDHARCDPAPNTMVEAFRRLPERWRAVLWLTAVEGGSPAQVAPILGLSADATAALAERATAGLQERYLRAASASSMPDPVPWLRAVVAGMPRTLPAHAAAAWHQWLEEDAATRRRGLAAVLPLGPWAERAVAGAAAAVFAVGLGTAIALSNRPDSHGTELAAPLGSGEVAAGTANPTGNAGTYGSSGGGTAVLSGVTTAFDVPIPRAIAHTGRTPAASPTSSTDGGSGSGGGSWLTDPGSGGGAGSTGGSGGNNGGTSGGTGGGSGGGGGGGSTPPTDQSSSTPDASVGANLGGVDVTAGVTDGGAGADVGGTTIGTNPPPAPDSTGVVVTVGGVTIHLP